MFLSEIKDCLHFILCSYVLDVLDVVHSVVNSSVNVIDKISQAAAH